MNASPFSNLFIFMFFSHRLLFLISMATLFLLASFSSLCLYELYIFCFSSLHSDEGLTSETSVSILSFLRCRIYIFITKEKKGICADTKDTQTLKQKMSLVEGSKRYPVRAYKFYASMKNPDSPFYLAKP